MGEAAQADDATVHSMAVFLKEMLRRVDLLDEVIHATRDQMRARLRVFELLETPSFRAQLEEAEKIIKSGERTPDREDLLERRLAELIDK
ncbi:MAG: hypothetical protein ACT452_12810 [Microthrixaceae bacterium]